MNIAYWIAAGLLAAVYAYSGITKLTQSRDQLRRLMGWVDTMPMRNVRMIGLLELLGAVGVILPPIVGIARALAVAAAAGLVMIQIGAFRLHISRRDLEDLWLNASLLVLAIVATALGASLWI